MDTSGLMFPKPKDKKKVKRDTKCIQNDRNIHKKDQKLIKK